MKNQLKRAALIAIPFFIQVYLFIRYIAKKNVSIYGSNDDALIASFSIDSELGIDRDNWIFIKSLISIPGTYLQKLYPEQGIYGLIIAIVIILSTSAIYILINYIPTTFLKIIYIFIISTINVAFTAPALLNPTYTGAAIFAGAVGFALIYFSIISHKVKSADILILASILISLSFLIRTEGFLLTFGFFLVLTIFYAIFSRSLRFNFQNLKLPLLLFGLIFLINLALDSQNYSEASWKNYLNVNKLRHSIQLRTAEYYLQENLSQIGWSEEDFAMFRKFSLYDDEILNVKTLKHAVEVSSPTRGLTAIINSNPKNELTFINYSYRTNHISVDMNWLLKIIIFLFFVLIVTTFKKSIDFLIYSLPIFVIFIGINYIFAVSYQLPTRLTFNFLFLMTITLLISAIIFVSEMNSVSKYSKYLVVFITMLFIIFTYKELSEYLEKKIQNNQAQLTFYEKQIADLNEFAYSNQKAVFIGTGSSIVHNYQNPFKTYLNIGSNDNILISGWHNLSPISQKKLTNRGLNNIDFHKEILRNPDLYWVDKENTQELLQKYFQQFSTDKVIVEDIGSLGNEFYRIYKISTVN